MCKQSPKTNNRIIYTIPGELWGSVEANNFLSTYVAKLLAAGGGAKGYLFDHFDADESGSITASEIVKGIGDLGISVTPELKTKLATFETMSEAGSAGYESAPECKLSLGTLNCP